MSSRFGYCRRAASGCLAVIISCRRVTGRTAADVIPILDLYVLTGSESFELLGCTARARQQAVTQESSR
jgi:hypothetical protein